MTKIVKGIPLKEYKQIHYNLNKDKYMESDKKRGKQREYCYVCYCDYSLKSKWKHLKTVKHLNNVMRNLSNETQ